MMSYPYRSYFELILLSLVVAKISEFRCFLFVYRAKNY